LLSNTTAWDFYTETGNKSMLTENDYKDIYFAYQRYSEKKELVIQEIERVLSVIAKYFGGKVSNWYFYGAQEGSVGELRLGDIQNAEHNYISFGEIECTEHGNMGEWVGELPSIFLYMTDEAIVEYIKNVEQKAREREEKEAEKRKAKQQKKNALRQQALAKLTPAERAAMGG
jgi:hypothetical protein